MHALIAFFLGPIGRYVGLALILGGIAWGAIHMIERGAVARSEMQREREARSHERAAKKELDRLLRGDDSGVRGFDRD
jgi:hypothetical protein